MSIFLNLFQVEENIGSVNTQIIGNTDCDFDALYSTDRGKCPNRCDSRKWKFSKETNQPQEEVWTADQSITLTACMTQDESNNKIPTAYICSQYHSVYN